MFERIVSTYLTIRKKRLTGRSYQWTLIHLLLSESLTYKHTEDDTTYLRYISRRPTRPYIRRHRPRPHDHMTADWHNVDCIDPCTSNRKTLLRILKRNTLTVIITKLCIISLQVKQNKKSNVVCMDSITNNNYMFVFLYLHDFSLDLLIMNVLI